MNKFASLVATTLALALVAPWAQALEMGELAARSSLGQPFVGEIPLRGELYSQIGPECARLAEPIDDAGLPTLQGIRFSYQADGRGGTLRLSGSDKVLEPTLQLSVFIGCGINLQRDYVLVMDLPGTPSRSEAPPTPARDQAAPAKMTPPAASQARRGAPATDRITTQPKPKPSKPAASLTAPKADPLERPAIASVAPETVPPPAPAEAAPTAPTPKEAAPAERPAPAPATQAAGESAPSEPWITAGLILLISLLLLGIWLQHRRNIREAALEEDYVHGEHPAAKDAFRGLNQTAPLPEAAEKLEPTLPKEAPTPLTAATLNTDDEMPILPANLKGEYMMDLTDVMLSFGETQRALTALNEFVHEHPDEAVAPWLRLLDLLRVHGKREEFQSLAIKLHQVFNIATPQWEATKPEAVAAPAITPPQPTSLEYFDHIRQRLQDTWGQEECMKYLDILMRDNRAGQRRGFPVEVVEELILLREVLGDRLNQT